MIITLFFKIIEGNRFCWMSKIRIIRNMRPDKKTGVFVFFELLSFPLIFSLVRCFVAVFFTVLNLRILTSHPEYDRLEPFHKRSITIQLSWSNRHSLPSSDLTSNGSIVNTPLIIIGSSVWSEGTEKRISIVTGLFLFSEINIETPSLFMEHTVRKELIKLINSAQWNVIDTQQPVYSYPRESIEMWST